MPARKIPDREREISEGLRAQYGGMMTLTDVRTEFGMKHPDTAKKYLHDNNIPANIVNGRAKWRVGDIAKMIYLNEAVQ